MTIQEAIETLKLMQGQIEWDYPMDYTVAVDMAVVALQKQISQKPVPDGYGSQCPVTVKDVKEALKTVLYAFSNRSDIPNSSDLVSRSYLLTEYDRQHQGPPGGARKIIKEAPPVQASTSQTKFKPGDKFILEIGEKRIGLDEYEIVGTDLYVWGSLLEKLTPYEQKWIQCEKELPKERDWYLGIFKEPDTGWVNPIPFICDYVGRETKITTKDFWILRGDFDGNNPYYKNLECVAWMPLPEPYRGDTE